ncbi:hypothetical protein KB559_20270 [Paenibacillus sp. Marseille-P2973]|uniref:hypothetical protein n=1 Tax=Paenibacillus sp. Marseille-P2973 TaxID=1871032 RepID=UPI001B4DF288|nr:hypothetical protein [Paenibacillus sp. Marseille-P2973]MBQ4901183.1 hypothetical protein [Paenibacillus sp. Marseille-P2973]
MISGIVLYSIAIIYLGISFIKDKHKTKTALLKSWKMFLNVIPDLLAIMLFIGLALAWSTVKLPVLVYEFTSFGLKFTFIHICFGLVFNYLTGILFEKIYSKQKLLKYDTTVEV